MTVPRSTLKDVGRLQASAEISPTFTGNCVLVPFKGKRVLKILHTYLEHETLLRPDPCHRNEEYIMTVPSLQVLRRMPAAWSLVTVSRTLRGLERSRVGWEGCGEVRADRAGGEADLQASGMARHVGVMAPRGGEGEEARVRL
eukprot:762128-Hanusia_phi.AAC.4